MRRFGGLSKIRRMLPTSVGCLKNISNANVCARGSSGNDCISMGIVHVASNFFHFVRVPVQSKRAPHRSSSLIVSRTLSRHLKASVVKGPLCGFSKSTCAIGKIYRAFISDICCSDRKFVFLLDKFSSCYKRYCVGYGRKRTRAISRRIQGVLGGALPRDIRIGMDAFVSSVHRSRTLRFGLHKVMLFFSMIILIVSLLNICSTIAVSARCQQGRVTVQGVGNTKVHRVI